LSFLTHASHLQKVATLVADCALVNDVLIEGFVWTIARRASAWVLGADRFDGRVREDVVTVTHATALFEFAPLRRSYHRLCVQTDRHRELDRYRENDC
jgi:hypothetical protein